jgi:hypothetical protein
VISVSFIGYWSVVVLELVLGGEGLRSALPGKRWCFLATALDKISKRIRNLAK